MFEGSAIAMRRVVPRKERGKIRYLCARLAGMSLIKSGLLFHGGELVLVAGWPGFSDMEILVSEEYLNAVPPDVKFSVQVF